MWLGWKGIQSSHAHTISILTCDLYLQQSMRFYEMTGLGKLPQVLVNGVPMKKDELDADSFEEAVVSGILKSTPDLQKAVYNVSGYRITLYYANSYRI